jgi:hypothetical protein
MSYVRTLPIVLTACLAIACVGCQQQAGRIFYRAGQVPVIERPEVRLAADGDRPATPAPAAAAATQPAQQAATQPVPYTSPRGGIRQLALLTLLAAGPSGPGHSAAKEAAESSLSASSLVAGSGIASLGAPQPRTLTAVVSQPGLQRGFAAGLGFARPTNIFTPRANPLTGPNGRCQELIRAGFFPNATACQRYFGK